MPNGYTIWSRHLSYRRVWETRIQMTAEFLPHSILEGDAKVFPVSNFFLPEYFINKKRRKKK